MLDRWQRSRAGRLIAAAIAMHAAVVQAIDEPQGETLGSTVWHVQASWVVR